MGKSGWEGSPERAELPHVVPIRVNRAQQAKGRGEGIACLLFSAPEEGVLALLHVLWQPSGSPGCTSTNPLIFSPKNTMRRSSSSWVGQGESARL